MLSVITNADTGATAFVPTFNGPTVTPTQTTLYSVTADAAGAGVTLDVPSFAPVLQREDGNYVGTDSLNHLVALGTSGLLWQQTVIPDGFGGALPNYPQYLAGVDDSVVTTSASPQPGSNATAYVVSSDGTNVSQQPSLGTTSSWLGNSYASLGSNVDRFAGTPPLFAPTYAAVVAGNQSLNGAAIWQVISPTKPASPPQKQLPAPDAVLHSNYNSLEILTSVSADKIFTKYLQTFAGAGNLPPGSPNANKVATIVHTPPPPVTSTGQVVTFRLKTWANYIGCGVDTAALFPLLPCPMQGDFSVETERFDPAAHTISVVTLKGHPLAGWRYWRVFSLGTMPDGRNDLVVETGAVDTFAGPFSEHPLNWAGYKVGRKDQVAIWEQDLQYILKTVQSDDDPSASQGGNSLYNRVAGVWDPQTPSQSDMLFNVCQSISCN